jgi:glycosyltransferase involved in cell wall biosynthesis
MRHRKILMDLSLAMLGFSGIPQDTRWLFKLLSQLDETEVSGLLYGSDKATLGFKFPKEGKKDSVLKDSEFLGVLLGSETNSDKVLNRLKILWPLRKLLNGYKLLFKRTFPIHKLQSQEFSDTIFRSLFSKGLTGSDFRLVTDNDFYASGLPSSVMFARIMVPFSSGHPRLDTRGFDYIIHEDSRSVVSSPGTQKIVRYHDMIPLLSPDLFENAGSNAKYHYKSIEACVKQGAIYVTNSEPTREDLVRHFPELEGRSYTIPYSISEIYKREENFGFLLKAIRLRLSDHFGAQAKAEELLTKLEKEGDSKKFRYLLGVATIEPRKNYINLIRAYNIVRAKKGFEDVKLIICGGMGWKNKEILQTMKPFVKSGDLLFLEDVHPSELKVIFSHASAFVFPTFSEGFGLPPVEAMKCGAPVISSDIKVHHWVQGDAALYVNPYDYENIADKMLLVLKEGREGKTVSKLINKGYERAELYASDRIRGLWDDFFNKVESEKE